MKNKTQKKKKKKNNNSQKSSSSSLSPEAKKSIFGVSFVFLGIFFAFSIMGMTGALGESLARVLDLFFGV